MDEISKDKLSQLLSNPESLKALSSIAKGLMTDEKKTTREITEQTAEQAVEKTIEQAQVPNSHYDERLNLLRSIKPYLTDSRQTRIDSLVKAINIANLINTYGQNL